MPMQYIAIFTAVKNDNFQLRSRSVSFFCMCKSRFSHDAAYMDNRVVVLCGTLTICTRTLKNQKVRVPRTPIIQSPGKILHCG